MTRRPIPALPAALAAAIVLGVLASGVALGGPLTGDAPAPRPDATIDLDSAEGLRVVSGEWRYSDARIVEVRHREPGPDLRASGAANRTWDIAPHAGGAEFDDSGWEVVEPGALQTRRGHGRLSFCWYRLRLTVPDKIGGLSTAGTTAIFEIVVDDYAEVWVQGRLPIVLGQSGGGLVRGFNAPNRVVLTRDARPGQTFSIAVFGANGPLSDPPANFVWIRSAAIDFFAPGRDGEAWSRRVPAEIRRLDPGLDAVVAPDAAVEEIAAGFLFTEGPVWHPDGSLLFSDPNANTIYRWSPEGQVSVFRTKSGYAGADIGAYGQPGSNGLTLDAEGRLVINEHGNRRVVRLEKTGAVTVLADRYDGKRLNSPNDLVHRSDGTLYFTDPPFGLPKFHDDPRRELPWSGVFMLQDGRLTVLERGLKGPNGLAFSPDERVLYVGNWDPEKKVVMRYDVQPDGTLRGGRAFVDMTGAVGEDAIDGVKVDRDGHVFVSGPGGVWILSPEGKHLGTIVTPEHPHNFAFGDSDGRTLYMTARSSLYRMRLKTAGIRPPLAPPRAAAAPAGVPEPPEARIERRDPRFDRLVPAGSRIEKIADGRIWVEGPVWRAADRALLFSDIPANSVFRWREGEGVRLFLERSGYSGSAPFPGREPGSNGLALDGDGRLVLCQHGDRRVTRLEADGGLTVLADRYRGRRFNSPNDVVLTRAGDLLFTDPPFGLPRAFDDPGREIGFSGVYRLRGGEVTLLTRGLPAPNGLALSPDERTLYVSNADPAAPAWFAFPVRADGTLGRRRLFRDATPWTLQWKGAPDGLKVDREGNLFAAGPGGVHVFAPDGTHLGSLITGVATSNCAWGEDGSALYITADTALYRIRLATRAAHWPEPAREAAASCPGPGA